MRKLVSGLLTLGLGLALLVAAPPAPGAALSHDLELTGRGFGHGHGMSQYGAKARAEAGHTHQQILAFYYPGTKLETGSDNSTLEVWLQEYQSNQLVFRPESGLSMVGWYEDSSGAGATSTIAMPTTVSPASGSPVAPTQWRLRLQSLTFVLEGFANGAWHPATGNLSSVLDGNNVISVRASDGTVRAVESSADRDHRGYLNVKRVPGSQNVRVVATVKMSDYLKSVVPSEMPASWDIKALRAQAVAARTYSTHEKNSQASQNWWRDTCNTTQCQVYNGSATYKSGTNTVTRTYEVASVTQAVGDTAGQILTYNGAAAFTQFSASNGGYALAGARPYLTTQPDPYDHFSWTHTITAAQLESKYPAIGSYLYVTTTRDGNGEYGGRITSITVTGTKGAHTVTGNKFRTDFGLRSTLFAISDELVRGNDFAQIVPSPDLTGDGYGDVLAVDKSGVLWLYRGKPNGGLQPGTQAGVGWGNLTIYAPGDFNGDGRADILAKDKKGDLYFYPGRGNGTFGSSTKAGWGWGPYDIIPAGDVTGDRIPDVLALDAQGLLYYYAGDGKGGFTGKLTRNGQGWTDIDLYPAGDLNGDGKADILSIRPDGTLHTHLGRGDGGFSKSTQTGQGWAGYELFAGADINRDGRADLLSRNAQGDLFYYAGKAGGFRASVQIGERW